MATSQIGTGSTFTLLVDPGSLENTRLLDQDDVKDSIEQLQKDDHNQQVRLSGHVLVVDDGASNRRLLELVLSRLGITVDTAENGAVAVEKNAQQQYDVVLMDVQMPVMDGYTAMQTIRGSGNDVPIVALTAHAMKEEENRAMAAGFSGFLTKPVNIDTVIMRGVRACPSHHRLCGRPGESAIKDHHDGGQPVRICRPGIKSRAFVVKPSGRNK